MPAVEDAGQAVPDTQPDKLSRLLLEPLERRSQFDVAQPPDLALEAFLRQLGLDLQEVGSRSCGLVEDLGAREVEGLVVLERLLEVSGALVGFGQGEMRLEDLPSIRYRPRKAKCLLEKSDGFLVAAELRVERSEPHARLGTPPNREAPIRDLDRADEEVAGGVLVAETLSKPALRPYDPALKRPLAEFPEDLRSLLERFARLLESRQIHVGLSDVAEYPAFELPLARGARACKRVRVRSERGIEVAELLVDDCDVVVRTGCKVCPSELLEVADSDQQVLHRFLVSTLLSQRRTYPRGRHGLASPIVGSARIVAKCKRQSAGLLEIRPGERLYR